MGIFNGQNLLEFSDRLKTNKNYKEYLARIKWNDNFKCIKCGHKRFEVRKGFSHTFNICLYRESVTENRLFYKVKFGVSKAFFIVFEMEINTKSISVSYTVVRFRIAEKTDCLSMCKVSEAMQSSKDYLLDGKVHAEEFVFGRSDKGYVGKCYKAKKKKSITTVVLTGGSKIKKKYAMRIENFSASSLQYMFVNHISHEAKITVDKWTGYSGPITKAYHITQVNAW